MKKVQSFVTSLALASVMLTPTLVFAQGLTGPVGSFTGTPGGSDLITVIRNIINILLVLVALVAVIYLIIGGLKYITSGGDDDKAGEAKNTILYALIGLVVIGLSVVVVNFVLSAIKGAGTGGTTTTITQ